VANEKVFKFQDPHLFLKQLGELFCTNFLQQKLHDYSLGIRANAFIHTGISAKNLRSIEQELSELFSFALNNFFTCRLQNFMLYSRVQ